jgi:ribosomal protein S18 acetylase RimI-like enzyme
VTAHLRRATAADARPIAELHVRSWKAAYPGLVPQDYLDALRPEDRLGMWEQALAGDGWPVVVVAEEGERLVGFVAVAPTGDPDLDPERVGEVRTLYLDPGAFGSGVADPLMEAGLEALVAGGMARAMLWALGTNARARRFYERRGWCTDGTTKVHDWGAFVAVDVRYVRDLA